MTTDQKDTEVLNVKYVTPKSIMVGGLFKFKDKRVVISKDAIIADGYSWSKACSINLAGFISVN